MRRSRLTSILSRQGNLTAPHDLREQLGLKLGAPYEFFLREDGTLTARFDKLTSENADGTSVRTATASYDRVAPRPCKPTQ